MKHCLNRLLSLALACMLLLGTVPAAQAAHTPFRDIPSNYWASESISRAVQLGLFRGETPTTFGRGHAMTRAAFTVVLCRLFGWETVTPVHSTYDDVQDPSRWYYSAVETAYAHGAITRQQPVFRPDTPITREEMAVMLVRSLGYTGIAGLAQELSLPFQDVDSNSGYLSMAYELGLMSGTTPTLFSPEAIATREQAAVTLMRLYDKYHAPSPSIAGIARSPEGVSACQVAIVPAGTLIYNGSAQISHTMGIEAAALIADAAHTAGAKALLGLSGTKTSLKASTEEICRKVLSAVEDGGYDGVYLDIPKLKYPQRQELSALVQALDSALGSRLLYVAAEAPIWDHESSEGYDYAALGRHADRVVLRIAPTLEQADSFPLAVPEAPEDLYYALAALKDTLPANRTSLMLTTTASVWVNGRKTNQVTGDQVQAFLADPQTAVYSSSRYSCPFLTTPYGSRQEAVVWYLDKDAAAERIQLLDFFGVDQVLLSDLSAASKSLLSGLH